MHERQQTLLHARAAGGGKAQKGHFLLDRSFHAAHKALAYHRAHAAAHEFKLKARRHQCDALHAAAHDHQRVGLAGVLQGLFQAFGVFAAVFELERINRQHFLADLVSAFAVQKHVQPGSRADAVVVAASGADVLVLLQIRFVQNGFATGALDPQSLGHAAALGRVAGLDFCGQ